METESKFPSITKHSIFTDYEVISLLKESKLTYKASLYHGHGAGKM